MRHFRIVLASAFLALTATPLLADSIVINFEGFSDSTPLTTQLPKLIFGNATVLTAGISLNEFEFPPYSGVNVVFDDGGPISILFAIPASSIGANFTYNFPLTITALDAPSNPIATATSAFSQNFVSSGNPANEFIQLSFAGGISQLIITGDPGGASFVMDDLTYTPVPELSTILLIATGGIVLAAARRKSIP